MGRARLQLFEVCDEDWVYTMQWQDAKLREIIYVLEGIRKSEQEKQLRQDYCMINKRLYRRHLGMNLLVVPKAVRWQVTRYSHDDMGHYGVEGTIKRILRYFWFPRIRKYVQEYIAACVECCFNKNKCGKPEGTMYSEPMEPIPFRLIHVDYLGPFIKSKRSNVIAISDAFTKFLVVKDVRNTKTQPVINALNELSSYFGLPTTIVTDRGTAFTSALFTKYCETNDIHNVKTAVCTPRANGQVERANQTILNFLRTTTNNPKEWNEKIREMQWSINSTPNQTTKFSPNELVFDFHLKDIVHNRLLAAIVRDENNGNLEQKRADVLANITAERAKWKQRFDNKHKTPKLYHEDELVLVSHEAPSTGESRKLEPKFRGPYKIEKVIGRDRYLVSDLDGLRVTQKPFTSIYSSANIKPWCSSPPDLDGHDSEMTNPNLSYRGDYMSGRAEVSWQP